jgi:hypothetical protein
MYKSDTHNFYIPKKEDPVLFTGKSTNNSKGVSRKISDEMRIKPSSLNIYILKFELGDIALLDQSTSKPCT